MTEYTYSYPKADNTVDAVVFSVVYDALKVLLIRRGREDEPFFDHWALPGGFINMDERLQDALRRELREETGLKLSWAEQLHTFGDPGRDPRGRVISTAFLATTGETWVKGGDDAAEAKWFEVPARTSGLTKVHWHPRTSPCKGCGMVPWPEKFAFDHEKILILALERLRSRIFHVPAVGASFLPQEFTLKEMRQTYDIVLGIEQDSGNFGRRIRKAGILEPTGKRRAGPSGRPAALYSFKKKVTIDGVLHVIYYDEPMP